MHTYGPGVHSADRHSQDESTKWLTIVRDIAIENVVAAHPVLSSMKVLHTVAFDIRSSSPRVPPSKIRQGQRAAAKALDSSLTLFTQGKRIRNQQGSMLELCLSMYIQTTLVAMKAYDSECQMLLPRLSTFLECNVCRVLILFLNCHPRRSVNSEWPLQYQFDSTSLILVFPV